MTQKDQIIKEVPDNGWISIKDKLPDYKEKILLVDADDRISTWYMLWENYWCVSICDKFTPIAWRPLPLPPSK